MIKKLKRYRIDYDGKKLFHEEHPNGEHVKYADILPLIEAAKYLLSPNADGNPYFQMNEGLKQLRQALASVGVES